MNLVTIPKRISGGKDDLIVISRKEYEELRARPQVKEFIPTKAQIRTLRAAEKRFAQGEIHSWEDVKQDLEARRRR